MLVRMFVIMTCLHLFGCTTITPMAHVCPKKPHTIRFATYNVFWANNNRDQRDPKNIMNVVKNVNPDIIVLQETHCISQEQLQIKFKHSHPYQLFRKYKYNVNEDGLGILSRYPIIKNIYFPPVSWFPAWLYVIKTPKGLVQVLNVHLNPPLVSNGNIGIFAEGLWATPKFRLMEIKYFHRYLDPNIPTIIAGDFNENDFAAASNYLRDHCFNDILLQFIPRQIKTWVAHFGFLTFTGRYDRIYTTRDITAVNTEVYQQGYSDHFPVILDYCN